MSTVFRLHQDNNTLNDWATSQAYGQNVINKIQDPTGGNAAHQITSIPSPFARIDLVKNAFKEVVSSKDLAGKTIYHKMVSDSLDVAEIFFKHHLYKKDIKIIKWNTTTDLRSLLTSKTGKHQVVGQTLEMYLQQDAAAYNFKQLRSIFLLQYTGPGAGPMDIIGATSPATLFFSSANNFSKVGKTIQFGLDKPFDDKYQPLYERDPALIIYLYALRLSIANFAKLFSEVDSYLDASFNQFQDSLKLQIRALDGNSLNAYTPIPAGAASNVEILGYPLHQKPDSPINSDFEISSDINKEKLKPLVLPITSGNAYDQLMYTTAPWGITNKAPIVDNRSLATRTLPHDATLYPYLTISDFLEDTILKINTYDINNGDFFDGNFAGNNPGFSYLLPLTNLFFEYFTTSNLTQNKMITMESLAGGVKVTLRIPIKSGTTIDYERIYNDHLASPDTTKNNDGATLTCNFSLALFPKIQFKNPNDADYRIVTLTPFDEINKYNLYVYAQGKKVPITHDTIRNTKCNEHERSKSHIFQGSNFDYIEIEIKSKGKRGLIIPHFKQENPIKAFTFSIDFGTTNTHIEYTVDGNHPALPFEISENEKQYTNLHTKTNNDWRFMLFYDYIPDIVGKLSPYRFPIRTALSHANDINWGQPIYPFANVNLPFPYLKKKQLQYNHILTDLKWSNEKNNLEQIRGYIETLMYILRNKVLLNDGNLSQTKIVWFYPISMTTSRFTNFKVEWDKAYTKYFRATLENISAITESVAPYEYFRKNYLAVDNICNIDIGGGTTDIVIAKDGNVQNITSFRFAANSIFGDGYLKPGTPLSNGIIKHYKDEIAEKLKANSLNDLEDVFSELNQSNNSANFASFFFSLEASAPADKISISFNEMLRNDSKYKILFILFYVAIVYHLAQILKSMKMEMPRHLSFSGNGAKIIFILSSDTKILEEFTRQIFEKVFDEKYPKEGLTIICGKNPKESTCKGGLCGGNAISYVEINKKKIVLSGSSCSDTEAITTYANVDENYLNQVVKQVEKYIDFTLNLDKDSYFNKTFGADPESIKTAAQICKNDLITFAKSGLAKKLAEVQKENKIEETLFFYPIVGMLHALSCKLHNAKI